MSLIISTMNSWGAAFAGFALPMLAQSAVVILLLLGLDWALRRKTRATVRYAVCLLALVKLILPPSLALPTGVAFWLPRPTLAASAAPRFDAATIDLVSGPETDRHSPPPNQDSNLPLRAPPSSSRTGFKLVSPALTWRAAVFILWLVVGAGMAVWVIRRGRLVSGVIRRSTEVPEPGRELAESCRRQLGIRRTVPVCCTPEIGSPAVCGLWRPVILIPPSLLDSSGRSEMRSVLLHELAHVRRGDLWANHAQILLQIVYWYNPLVWLANARIRRLREQAVDEMTLVELGEEAESYPETLLRVAKLELRRPALTAGLVGIIGSGRALAERIRNILNRPVPKTARIGMLGFSAVMVLALMMLPMACRPVSRQTVTGQTERGVWSLPSSTTAAEALKAFLASSRETGEIIYSERVPATIAPPRPKDWPPQKFWPPDLPPRTNGFRAFWQPGAYVYLQVPNPDFLPNPARSQIASMVGKTGETSWSLDNGILHLHAPGESSEQAGMARNRDESARGRLDFALGFGILHVPGTLRWTGNKFTAAHMNGTNFAGELVVSKDGTPEKLLWFWRSQIGSYTNSATLIYGSPGRADRLPDGFSFGTQRPGQDYAFFSEVHILWLSSTNTFGGENKFSPESVLASLDAPGAARRQGSTNAAASPIEALRRGGPAEEQVKAFVAATHEKGVALKPAYDGRPEFVLSVFSENDPREKFGVPDLSLAL